LNEKAASQEAAFFMAVCGEERYFISFFTSSLASALLNLSRAS